MKVILYMAMSANGMIAKSDDDTKWVSDTEWESFRSVIRDAGCLVIGHRTYEIMTKQPELAALDNVRMVVVSKQDFSVVSPEHIIAHSPEEALEKLKCFATVVVAGGGMLNASFLEQKLVDEIYLDVEPLFFGKGIKLFADGDFETRLELLETKKLSPNEIQLHYRVLK